MRHFEKIGFVILIGLLSFLLNRKEINEFPSYMHAWAQSDHYAIAIGFTQNKLNFFLPQTYNLNPQFPGKFRIPKDNGITAVDFPIHQFLPGVAMKLSGEIAPWYFRIYLLIYSLIGLLYLYLLSNLFIKNKIHSLFITVFALSSPIYLYYQAGFLPTIPSLSNLFIALYFYFKYKSSENQKDFFTSVFFLVLASLSRTPFSIFCISIIGIEIIQAIKYKRFNYRVFIPLLSGALIVAGYFIYNMHLRDIYGSVFLAQPLPPDDLNNALSLVNQTLKNWFFQYFTIYHYIFILLLICLLLYVFARQKRQFTNRLQNQLISYIFLTIPFTTIYCILMLKQFPAHDYYFLDTFYPLLILGIIGLLSFLKIKTNSAKRLSLLVLSIFCFGFIIKSNNIQKLRRQTGDWDNIEITKQNFTDSEKFLNSLNISESAKILVIDSYTPNIPFILMKRKGYGIMATRKENIKNSIIWKYDYIVIQDYFLMTDVIRKYPQLVNQIEKIGGNGKISVYKKLDTPKNTSIDDFLKYNVRSPILKSVLNFDSIPEESWQNISTNPSKYNESEVGILTEKDEFGITFSHQNLKILTTKQNTLLLKGQFQAENDIANVWVVVSVESNNELKFYRRIDLGSQIDNTQSWERLYFIFTPIPKIENDKNELKVYIWNEGRNNLFYDDITIELY